MGKNSVKLRLAWFLLLTLALAQSQAQNEEFLEGTFPDDFEWGFATSAYQIEGGHNADDKGESIWDEYAHRIPTTIKDGTNGDIACDSYHKYREDVQLLKAAGADYYRFSLSWPRILPNGTPDKISWEGIAYYNNLINELLANGIRPMVTLYHWDLPQPLQEFGGWENETMIEYFTAFSEVAYGAFGDRVKQWLTFNEPWVFCVIGYGNIGLAPGVTDPLHAHYQCVHTVLKAHANSYHLYNDIFKPKQHGVCGITLDANWYEPATNEPRDIEAAERTRQFKHGWLGSPLFFGKYPDQMREYIDRRSAADGLPSSRLPVLDDYWSNRIKGSLDYLGLNHYTTELIAHTKSTNTTPDWWGDQETDSSRDPTWTKGESDWLYVVPWGFRRLLNWIKDTYGNPPLYVTENGFSESYDAGLADVNRTAFYRSYINEMLKAVVIDGCDVKSYTAWSLLDNFEWSNGYTERFGVHWVNFTDPDRTRIPKDSAKFLKEVFANNGFPPEQSSGSATTTAYLSRVFYLCTLIIVGLLY